MIKRQQRVKDAKMAEQVSLNGLAELLAKLDSFKDKNDVYILFTGSKDVSGKSWCPDCNDVMPSPQMGTRLDPMWKQSTPQMKADPVIKKSLTNAPEGSVFITCIVGNRPVWKNPENEFRKHPQFKLTGIPTLMKWKTPSRLGDQDCKKQDLVDMIFED